MTKNNQSKNLIDSSKVFVLGFGTQVRTWFRTRDGDCEKNKKMRPVTHPETLLPSHNPDLAPLGPCSSEPLQVKKQPFTDVFQNR